jgi:hypothetical protein
MGRMGLFLFPFFSLFDCFLARNLEVRFLLIPSVIRPLSPRRRTRCAALVLLRRLVLAGGVPGASWIVLVADFGVSRRISVFRPRLSVPRRFGGRPGGVTAVLDGTGWLLR